MNIRWDWNAACIPKQPSLVLRIRNNKFWSTVARLGNGKILPQRGGVDQMKVLEFRSVGALALVGLLVALSSCAHDQQLVSIAIVPTEETFGDATTPVFLDAGASVQLRATGTYIHPPVTKDITAQVQWGSD